MCEDVRDLFHGDILDPFLLWKALNVYFENFQYSVLK
jgi:hypothetical protein